MDLPAKTWAYLRASEVVERARAERGMHDRATAAAINKELKLIAERLKKSAQKTYNNDSIKQRIDKDPEFKKLMEASKKYRRYVNAKRITQRIEDEYRKMHNTEG